MPSPREYQEDQVRVQVQAAVLPLQELRILLRPQALPKALQLQQALLQRYSLMIPPEHYPLQVQVRLPLRIQLLRVLQGPPLQVQGQLQGRARLLQARQESPRQVQEQLQVEDLVEASLEEAASAAVAAEVTDSNIKKVFLNTFFYFHLNKE